MSAVASLNFDPAFGMGSRQTYQSWPVFENNQNILSNDLSSQYAPETSSSPPPTSRSITSSPPREHQQLPSQQTTPSHAHHLFSPEQRELKRQHDQARRHDKIVSRRSTVGSTASASSYGSPYGIGSIVSSASVSPKQSLASVSSIASISNISSANNSVMGSPSFASSSTQAPVSSSVSSVSMPTAISDLVSTAHGSLPGIYSTSAPSQMPLMAEAVATTTAGMASPSYISSNYGSPAMHDHAGNQNLYSSPYQNTPYMPEYTTTSFSQPAQSTLHSQYPRTAMSEQQNLVYPMPPPYQQHQQPSHSPLPHPMSMARPHHHQSSPPMHHGHHAQHPAHPHHQHHPYDGYVAAGHPSVPHTGMPGPSGAVRVVGNARPKPQCFEHGCNGRQFSTFSNLLRHQREKNGHATKSTCPKCGAEFTRTTARNGHLLHDKCKRRTN